MKLFSIKAGKVTPGALISSLHVLRNNRNIPVIRSCKYGNNQQDMLIVDESLVRKTKDHWELKDPEGEFAIGRTRKGAPKLIKGEVSNEECIVVFTEDPPIKIHSYVVVLPIEVLNLLYQL